MSSMKIKAPLFRGKKTSIGAIIARLLATIIFVAVAGVAGGFVAWTLATSDGPLKDEKIVDIPMGSSASDIADILQKEGVIDNHLLATAGITGIRHVFAIEPKAGEYQFAARSSLVDVLRKIKSGKIVTYKVSVPEGFTTWQVLERLKAHEVLTGEIEKVPLEGELLPDTYVFSRGRTRQSIIDQMQAAQLKLIEKLWPTRASDLPFETPQQALILASIVEKETGVADERARVAAVFVNRMRKGMRLQSDPTIIYGITKGQGKLERPIYRSDINEKTEYNTYQINGLPPTPIANAGTESIKAVLNPIESDELFFVADGTGGHVFAKTLAEHNENVKKWRTWLKDRDKEKDEQQADQDQNQELAAVEEQATNTDAPLPAIAGAVEAPTETAKPSAVEADDGKIPTFKFVKVAGRDVPIPKAKPVR